jgi:hypothetical protein
MKTLNTFIITLLSFCFLPFTAKTQILLGVHPSVGFYRMVNQNGLPNPIEWSEKPGADFIRAVTLETQIGLETIRNFQIRPLIGYRVIHYGFRGEQIRDAFSWTRRSARHNMYHHGFTAGVQFAWKAASFNKGSLWPFMRFGGALYFHEFNERKEELVSYLSPNTVQSFRETNLGFEDTEIGTFGANAMVGLKYLIPLKNMNLFVFSNAEIMNTDILFLSTTNVRDGWAYGLNLGLEIEPFKRKTKK